MPAVPHVQIGAQIRGTSSGVFCISMDKSSLCDHPWLIAVKAEEMVRSLGCTSVGLCVLLISFASWRFNVTAHDCRHGRVRSQTRNFGFQTCHNIMFPRPAQVDRVQIAMTRLVVLGWIKKKTELLTCVRNYKPCFPQFILHKSSTCKWRRGIDNHNDHSSCRLSIHNTPTYPEGQSQRALANFLYNDRVASCRNNVSENMCSLVPLETKWELATQTNASPQAPE